MTSKHVMNIVRKASELGIEVPLPQIDDTDVSIDDLTYWLTRGVARQEMLGKADELYVPIPPKIRDLQSYRSTPLQQLSELSKALGLKGNIWVKREDLSPVGNYKLNSALFQAYFAKEEGVGLISETGPGNWGIGLAYATSQFGVPLKVFMELQNAKKVPEKVQLMQKYGADVKLIDTKEGTIASGITESLKYVDDKNKLALGCLSNHAAMHNSVIGLELEEQMQEYKLSPSALVSVCGGGSSFIGMIAPFLGKDISLIAAETERIPSFTQGEYVYEHPDTAQKLPKIKMYTLGNKFSPESNKAAGLNYHGKNAIISALYHNGFVTVETVTDEQARSAREQVEKFCKLKIATESSYSFAAAIKLAQEKDGDIVTLITSR